MTLVREVFLEGLRAATAALPKLVDTSSHEGPAGTVLDKPKSSAIAIGTSLILDGETLEVLIREPDLLEACEEIAEGNHCEMVRHSDRIVIRPFA